MSSGHTRLRRCRFVLATLLATAALASPRPAADQAATREFAGACYCRAKTDLMCTPNLTARECELRSTLALCDDWFWKERLPCWNWGYGG